MGNVQMEADQIRFKNASYGNVQTALTAALTGGGGSTTLASLTDTDITTPSNGQVLTYDSTAEKWENSPIPAQSITGLSDTTISTPTDGQVLTYDGTAEKWVNASGGSGDGYTITAFTPKKPSGSNYENYAEITLSSGIYHMIVGVYSDNTSYPTTGVRVMSSGNQLCCVSDTSSQNNPCCMGIFEVPTTATYTVQIKGNANTTASGYYMYKKIADIAP